MSPAQASVLKPVLRTNSHVHTTADDFEYRLKIPQIGVNAAVESVGLTQQGAVDVPVGSTNVGWYKYGPRPGESSSAVIVGHFGVWKKGAPTVFNDLYKLRSGDKIYVEDQKGEVVTFIVRKSRTYRPNEDVAEVFDANDPAAHLNLITCSGVWNKITKSYSKRLVVFADKKI